MGPCSSLGPGYLVFDPTATGRQPLEGMSTVLFTGSGSSGNGEIDIDGDTTLTIGSGITGGTALKRTNAHR